MLPRLLSAGICAVVLLSATSANADPGVNLFSNFIALFTSVPREMVGLRTDHPAGTIIVRTSERRLYLVTGKGQALRYGIGVGRTGAQWHGTETITAKREWPDWTPPPEMLKRRPDLPRHMQGGPANPLGARAMYLGNTQYRIHGSNEPHTVGTAASAGCIRMTNDDVIDLYNRVRVGALVVVQ